MLRRSLLAALLAALPGLAPAQTVHQLKNQPPNGAQLTFLLTDGRVLAQAYNNSSFYALTPDNTGSYLNGTWKQVASLPSGYSPSAMSSQVLADGRVLVEGGEYSNGGQFTLTNQGAIYDPVKDKWTTVKHPPHWQNIGDSPSVVLSDGTFLLGDKLHKRFAALDPKTMTWSAVANTGKKDFNAEEGWTLMPDGTVLTFDVKAHPNSESFNPATQVWSSLGSTIVNLQAPDCSGNCCLNYPPSNKCYYPPGEVGPAVLMPDGTVIATGATSHNAIYTPGTGWAVGPDFPNGDAAGDSFASLAPNGHAVIQGNSGTLYEWDGKTLTRENINAEGGFLTVLPTGEILVGGFETYTSS